MSFVKYQHIERLGTDAVNGLLDGKCYVFPKIDGTNGSLWFKNGIICAGSRNRELSQDSDNAGFYQATTSDPRYMSFFQENPSLRLYGEWLVPHSLKTYRDDAWRKYYVFDVRDESGRYLTYEEYKPILEKHNIDYIPAIAIVDYPNEETLYKLLDRTGAFLIKDGCGNGEGIVIKRYDFVNRYGHTIWAKIVTSEFKEKHLKEMGAPFVKQKLSLEDAIAEKYCTEAFIEKEQAKIIEERGGWESKFIPELLSKCYYNIVVEEIWNICKEHKNPIINFRELNQAITRKIKRTKPELF